MEHTLGVKEQSVGPQLKDKPTKPDPQLGLEMFHVFLHVKQMKDILYHTNVHLK